MTNLKVFYLLLFISPCFSFSRSGAIITDLTSTNSADFENEANLWSLSNAVCSSCSKIYTTPPNSCGVPQEIILGGPNIMGPSGASQVSQDFTSHYPNTAGLNVDIALEYDFWIFSNQVPSSPIGWTSTLNLGATGITKKGGRADLVSSCTTLDYTDSGGNTIKAFYKYHVQRYFNNGYADKIQVIFQSLLTVPSTETSFGFRNVKYTLSVVTSNPPVAANFPCGSGYYWSGCSTCGGSASDSCSACKTTTEFLYPDTTCLSTCPSPLKVSNPGICVSPCTNPTDNYFSNGTCISVCPSLLTKSTVYGINYCNSPCPNQYIYYDGTCSTDCLAPLVKAEEPSDIKYCRSPCADTNAYIFKNGSCTSQCLSPLVASTVKGNKFCNSPCPSQYIFYDGTCSADCLTPLVKADESSDIKYCRSPCTDTNAYIFKNGSCTSQCLSPLIASTVKGNKFCNSPCPGQYIYIDGTCSVDCLTPLVRADESSDIKYCRTPCANVNDYIYPNGTCTSQCPSLLVKSTVKGNNFCKSPCPSQYIYYDGTCSTACAAPMVQRAESTIKFCVSPCQNPQEYFYEVDQRCFPACSDPYEPQKIYNLKFCFLSEKLSLEQVREIKGMVASLITANKVGAAIGKVTTSVSSTSSVWAFLAAQVSMLFSIRYIDVGYPDKVKLMFKLQGASPFSISFDFNIPDGVEKRLVKRSPPRIFEEYEVPSNFLENSWDTLMTLMLTLFSILALSVVKKMLKGKCSGVNTILSAILSFLKWNIPLMIFCSSFGDMYFFASLQFQSGISDSTAWEIISLILAILLVIIGVAILIIPVKIAKDMQLRDQNLEKWKSFEHLFDGQKRTSLVSLCFLAIYLTATIISNLMITNLYVSPLCESLLITMISIVMFFFLVIQRPFRELKSFFQVLVNQLLLMTVHVCVVILAIMDDLEIGKQDIRDKVGEAIIVIFFCSMASGLVFATIETLFTLFEIFKFFKELKAKQGSLSLKGIFNAFFHGDPIEKNQEKLDLEQRRKRQTAAHRQRVDLSFGGKPTLQPPRKGKSPQKNFKLNISYQDSNGSGIDLIHQQSSDYSIDLSRQLDLSPSFPSRGRLPNQQRLNKINRQVSHQRSDFSVETINHSLPPKGSASTFQPKIKQRRAKQPDGENERRAQKIFNISNVSSPKRKINQTTSHSPKRKNQIQKRTRFLKQSEGN